MNRLWTVPALALIIAAIIFSGIFCINKYAKAVDDKLAAAYNCSQNSDLGSAAKYCRQAADEWEQAEKLLRIFVNESELSDIGLTLSSLRIFAEHGQTAELQAQINIARTQLKYMQSMEALTE